MLGTTKVPPETAGWMVRVGAPPSKEEFYFVAIADQGNAESAVRESGIAAGNEAIEGVATLTPDDLRELKLQSGQIIHTRHDRIAANAL